MTNMGYCKFENTFSALKGCISHIRFHNETSESEVEFAKRLYRACEEYIYQCEENGVTDESGEVVEV